MALIVCPDCNNQISEFAKQCPFCGRPVVNQDAKPKTNYGSVTPVSTPTTVSNTVSPQPETASASTPPANNYSYNQGNNNTSTELPPKSWVIESILVTCFCCMPMGIAAIIYATKVESLWYAGDKEAAYRASRDAGKWTKIGFFCSLAGIALYLIFVAIVFGLGVMGNL